MVWLFVVGLMLFSNGVRSLTIDSQLGTSIEDCFERAALGERLPTSDIYRNISELTARECEKICKQDKQCQSFDYGVGAKGNATCSLSKIEEKDIKSSKVLQRHPDHDVYVRRFNCEQSPPTPLLGDGSNVPNRPVIRPGQLEDLPDNSPQRPVEEVQRPVQERPSLDIHRPLHDLKPYESNYRPSRPFINNAPYGRPIKNQNDYHVNKPNEYLDTDRPYYEIDQYNRRPDKHDRYGTSQYNDMDYERPDDYGFQKPEVERPIGYGAHIAPDIPFKPRPIHERPPHYRPSYPGYNHTYTPNQPDPNDVFYFQNNYNYDSYRPSRPESLRPDPYFPARPEDEIYDSYGFQKPSRPYAKPVYNMPSHFESDYNKKPINHHSTTYDHFERPIKKPYPQFIQKPDSNQYENRPDPIDSQKPYPSSPGYGNLYPIRPSIEKPYIQNRPYNRPIKGQHKPNNVPASYNKPNYNNDVHKPGYYSHNLWDQPQRPHKPSEQDYSHSYSEGHGPQSGSSYGSHRPIYGGNSHSSYGGQSHSSINGNQIDSWDYSNAGSSSYGGQSSNSGHQIYDSTPKYGNTQSGYENSAYGTEPTLEQHGVPNSEQYATQHSQSTGYGSQSGGGTTNENSPSYGQNGRPSLTQSNQVDHYGNSGVSVAHGNRPLKPKPSAEKPVYEYEFDKPVGERPNYIQRPGGEVVSSKPIAVGGSSLDYGSHLTPSYSACYRRVLAGRRALRSHVRRVLACSRLEDCQRECAGENRFHCESFNYKLDPSFRRKGICELMTKPIEHFDLHRDFVEDRAYDFYELDRNSLQPECRPSWNGPTLAHSGYLGGSSQHWRPGYDRNNQNNVGYRNQYDHRRNYGTSHRYGGDEYRRGWEDFVPYQIGIGRSNDEDWAQYGGSYGPSHHDRSDHINSLNYWGLDQELYARPHRLYGVKPHGHNNDFNYYNLGNQGYNGNAWVSYGYGGAKKWSESGSYGFKHGSSGLVYGERSYYGPNHSHDSHKGHYHHGEDHFGSHSGYDCSSRRRAGMSLGAGAVRRSLRVRTVLDCEAACSREAAFRCVSYSYRYSKAQAPENCFLSETPYRGLELASDVGSDVYSMADPGRCDSATPWIESECFLHVRSGKAVAAEAVEAALVTSGLGACEAECIRARGFFCRGFSFRFEPVTIGESAENCLLTSSPARELRARTARGHELYARGNYGRGCETDLPAPPASAATPAAADTQCYLQYDSAARLAGDAARGRARVPDAAACARACTAAPFSCLSFSYSSSLQQEDNCLLSEIRLFDLQLGVDYDHSSEDLLFAFDLFSKECWRKIIPSKNHGSYTPEDHTSDIPIPLIPPPNTESSLAPPSEPPHQLGYPSAPGHPDIHHGYPGHHTPGLQEYPSLPSGPSHPGHFGSASVPGYHPGHPDHNDGPPTSSSGFRPSGYLPETPGFIQESPGSDFKPGYLPEPAGSPGYPAPGHPAVGHPGHHAGSWDKGVDDYDDQFPISWRHYTVSGLPCRRGSACAQNVVAGHWSCEPEGGEVGAWDYCCAPAHRCGYSEGFHKPWCYVGQSSDQWRPCSEKYYPYHQHSAPHPSLGHREEQLQPIRPPGHAPHRRPAHRPWTVPDRPDHAPIHHRPAEHGPINLRPVAPDSYLPNDDLHKPALSASPYLPEADRKYWDDLYENGPKAYYDRYGNPLPGYARVPPAVHPHSKYEHSYGPPHSVDHHWSPHGFNDEEFLEPPVPGGLGAPRYWPVAYLHKGPPPNTTYFNYQDSQYSTSTERHNVQKSPIIPPNRAPPLDFNRGRTTELPIIYNNNVDSSSHRDEKTRNLTRARDDEFILKDNATETTTEKNTEDSKDVKDKVVATNSSESTKTGAKSGDAIDDKIDDFSSTSLEILNLEDAKNQKGEKSSEVKTLEAEERQIEEIGRLLATRRGSKFLLEKRSQSDSESQNIKISRDLDEPNLDNFNFGTKFVPVSTSKIERRGIVQKVPKEYVSSLRTSALKTKTGDQSLELSETTHPRPTTAQDSDIKKAYLNGQVFYDASIDDEIKTNDGLQKPQFIKISESKDESKSEVITTAPQKSAKTRVVGPPRKGRRSYRRKYNPEEVRKRLLDREKSKEVL